MDSPYRGIILKCCSVTLFTIMAALIKATADGPFAVPAGQQVFFRSFFAIPVILLWLLWRRDLRTGLRTTRPLGHFIRGIAGTAAMALNFLALSLLPFPEATALGYATPLFVVLLAALLLGERVRLFRLSMVGLGLAGVVIVLLPQLGLGATDSGRLTGVAAALSAAGCAALAQVFIRKLVQAESVSAIVFWFSITSTLLSLLTIPFGWVMPDAATFALLVATGILGGFGQIFLTSAYRHSEASLIAPFDYVSMLLSIAIGWFFFGEMATWGMLLGSSLVILAGLLIIWRERKLGLERNRQRRAMTPQG